MTTPEDINQHKQQLVFVIQRQLRNVIKRIEKAKEEFERNKNWKDLDKEGDLLKANYSNLKRGMEKIVVVDWETNEEKSISLNPKLTPQQEVAFRYRQSKKREKSLPHLQNYIEKLEKEKLKLEGNLEKVSKAESAEPLKEVYDSIPKPPTRAEKKEKEIRKALPYHEFTSKTGTKILVGKSARDNEILTFNVANGSDWWLHAHGCPGSHVVIKTEKGRDPDEETLKEAIRLALTYSKAKKRGEGDVCVTQRKYVTKYRGNIGTVQVSKHKLIYGRI